MLVNLRIAKLFAVAALALRFISCASAAPGDENWAGGFGVPPAGNGVDNCVFALAAGGGNIYAGGFFNVAGSAVATNIARWNGSSWSAVGGGVGDQVNVIAALGTNVYVGGYFTNAVAVSANHIARWNGTSLSALGSGVGGVAGFVSA